MSIPEIVNKSLAWHVEKWPDCPPSAVVMKLAEEAGELVKAVNLLEHGMYAWPGWLLPVGAFLAEGKPADSPRAEAHRRYTENLKEEIGDVAHTLFVLCARYGLDFEAVVSQRIREVHARPLREV